MQELEPCGTKNKGHGNPCLCADRGPSFRVAEPGAQRGPEGFSQSPQLSQHFQPTGVRTGRAGPPPATAVEGTRDGDWVTFPRTAVSSCLLRPPRGQRPQGETRPDPSDRAVVRACNESGDRRRRGAMALHLGSEAGHQEERSRQKADLAPRFSTRGVNSSWEGLEEAPLSKGGS